MRQRYAAHGLVGLVFDPATACQIATHHRFHGNRLEPLDQHGAARHLGYFVGLHHAFRGLAREVVGANVRELVKPKQSHLGEQFALAGNGLAHDDVKRADAVGGHHQNAVISYGIVVADFAAREQRQGMQSTLVQARHPQCTRWAKSPRLYLPAMTCSVSPLILAPWPSQPNSM